MRFEIEKIMSGYNLLKQYAKENPDNTQIQEILDRFAEGIAYTASGENIIF